MYDLYDEILDQQREVSQSMDNFKAVYKILSALEKAMDLPEFGINEIGSEKMKVSDERWSRYMEMMTDVGYIKGIRIVKTVTGETEVQDMGIRITLKGLEYLQENSIMRKIYNTAKGIKEVTPGL